MTNPYSTVNTTDYQHPRDPNLCRIENTLKYNADGEPVMRTHVDGISLQGDVIVDKLKLIVDSAGNTLDETHYAKVTVTNGTITVTGTVNIGTLPEVEIKNDSNNPISISRNTSVNSASNRLFVSMESDSVIADSNYFFNVGRGLLEGQYLEFKNGYCNNMIGSTTGLTVWNEGTVYPWSSWTTAQLLYIISDSSSDAGQTIWINGLNSAYSKISETIVTNGLTSVHTLNQYLRINNVIIVSGNANVGTIRTRIGGANGTIVGSMAPTTCRNKQGVFTVPIGHTAYIMYGDISSYKNGTGNVSGLVEMRIRTGNSPFINAYTGVASNGQYRSDFPIPFKVPATSDIDVRFAASGNGTTVACSWEMILIPD